MSWLNPKPSLGRERRVGVGLKITPDGKENLYIWILDDVYFHEPYEGPPNRDEDIHRLLSGKDPKKSRRSNEAPSTRFKLSRWITRLFTRQHNKKTMEELTSSPDLEAASAVQVAAPEDDAVETKASSINHDAVNDDILSKARTSLSSHFIEGKMDLPKVRRASSDTNFIYGTYSCQQDPVIAKPKKKVTFDTMISMGMSSSHVIDYYWRQPMVFKDNDEIPHEIIKENEISRRSSVLAKYLVCFPRQTRNIRRRY